MFGILCITVISVFIIVGYFIHQRKIKYWDKKNVPYLQPTPILGNFSEFILLKENIGVTTQKLCQKFPNEPYFGVFYGTEPTLIIQDPNIIKLVTTQDYQFFSGRENTQYNDKEFFFQNVFFAYGAKWKVLRQTINPLFSSAKMKNMFYLIERCSKVLEGVLDEESETFEDIEVTALMAKYTMDCIGSCVFGVDMNTQKHKKDNPFNNIGEVVFATTFSRGFKNVARSIWPGIFYFLGLRNMPKEIESFFFKLLNEIFEKRQYKPTSRNDFVDLALKSFNNKETSVDNLMDFTFSTLKSEEQSAMNSEINYNTLVSQCVGIFAAGYESSATTLSFIMFELAKNPEVQDKVLAEVDEYLRRHNNVLKYESVAEMPYLEACIDETLRLHPALVVVTREVMEDYVFPNGLKLEKGIRVHIPVYHLHHNPELFPEPEKFRPERFIGKEKRNVKPYTYMPFGEGPKTCIGMRFARMKIVTGLITLLKKYRLQLADGMKSYVPLEPKAIITKPVGGITLKFIKREGWEQRILKSI